VEGIEPRSLPTGSGSWDLSCYRAATKLDPEDFVVEKQSQKQDPLNWNFDHGLAPRFFEYDLMSSHDFLICTKLVLILY
jgi:hypothetical protein